MSILKAFLVTILLIVIEATLTFGLLSLNHFLDIDHNNAIHINEISKIISKLFGYLTILILIFKLPLKKGLNFKRLTTVDSKLLLFIFITILGCTIISQPIYDIKLIIDSLGDNYIEPLKKINENYNYLLWYKFVSAVVLAPILEELLFRKIIFSGLQQKYSLTVSVIVSTLCFGLIHFPNWQNVMSALIFGLICSLVYVKTKNIICPILFHLMGNLIAIAMTIYSHEISDIQQQLNYNWIYWTVFLTGIGLTIFGLRKMPAPNRVDG